MLCCVKKELKRQGMGGWKEKGDPGRKGDPGIHMHITEGKLLALTSSQLCLQPLPYSRLQAQRTETLTIQFVILPLSGEKEVK